MDKDLLTVGKLIDALSKIENKDMPILRFNDRSSHMLAIQAKAVLKSQGYVVPRDYKRGTPQRREPVMGIEIW